MLITAVDSTRRLFQISDILPADTVERILTHDWLSEPNQPAPRQENLIRRHVTGPQAAWLADSIAQSVDTEFYYVTTMVWLDLPGFECPIHLDSHRGTVLQLYWLADDARLGTYFYHDHLGTNLRYAAEFKANTGYILLDNPANGLVMTPSWHGVPNSSLIDTYRLSTYSIICSRI